MDRTLIRNIVIGVVLIGGILFLYWKFDYSKNSANISTLKADYEKLNTQVEEARKVASRKAEYEAKLKILEKQLEIANTMLPDSSDYKSVINRITLLANKNNIKINKLGPKSPISGADYSTLSYDLDVSGTYNSIALFLTDLGNLNRIYQVSDISVDPLRNPEGDYTVSSKFMVKTYYKGTSDGSTKNKKGGK